MINEYRKFNKALTEFLKKVSDVPKNVKVYFHTLTKTYELWWQGGVIINLGSKNPPPSHIVKEARIRFLKIKRGDYEKTLGRIESEEKTQAEKSDEFLDDLNVKAGKEWWNMYSKSRGLEHTPSVVISNKRFMIDENVTRT